MVWLRLLHIVAGSIWVGSAVVVALFLLPTARAAGPDGGRFLGRLMERMGPAFGIAMLLTVVPGFIMYNRISGGFDRAWVASPTGLALGAGAVAALLAVVVGMGVNNPARRKIVTLRKGLETGGRTPTATETAQLAQWQGRIERGAQVTATFLVVAAGTMAVARYL
jgi:uncharacterized membrane protein